ncbi:hypothetical protein BDB01DRAFT_788492 [Pilobolus umbonatus]|nr:hypothetical protein BDB01DRAFT_788492 [Pilobolus umbonatus]
MVRIVLFTLTVLASSIMAVPLIGPIAVDNVLNGGVVNANGLAVKDVLQGVAVLGAVTGNTMGGGSGGNGGSQGTGGGVNGGSSSNGGGCSGAGCPPRTGGTCPGTPPTPATPGSPCA